MIRINGNEYDDETVQKAFQAMNTTHQIRTKSELMRQMGSQYDGDREIYDVLGYDKNVESEQYRAKYRRQDIAKRIVEMPAKDTWRRNPRVFDDESTDTTTEFEDDIEELARNHRLYHYCRRADIASGIGEYGLLFIGVKDKQPLDEEVNANVLESPEDLAFMTPFAQDSVQDWKLGRDLDRDPTDPRYNKPVQYSIDFSDIDEKTDEDTIEDVHWSRIIHIAEGLVESDLKGTPRLRPVYNRLEDLEKVTGASAEMFWGGADRKFQFNIDTDDTQNIDPNALDELDEEVKNLVHDMESYIKTFNTDMNVIGGEDPDPSGIVDELLKFISGATGIPKRLLTGSERGELASTQDRANWYGRIESRQKNFAEPVILKQLIDRLIDFGIVSDPQNQSYQVEWPTLFELTDLEQAELQKARATALKNAAPNSATDMFGDPEELMDFIVDGEKPDFDADDGFNVDPEEQERQFNLMENGNAGE